MSCTRHCLFAIAIVHCNAAASYAVGPFAANGLKIGELNGDSVKIWVRLTAKSEASDDGLAPGMPGEVRVRLKTSGDAPFPFVGTATRAVSEATDFTWQFDVDDLHPDQQYEVEAVARQSPQDEFRTVAQGSFRTPPSPAEPTDVAFTVVTGQRYENRDDPTRGHRIYQSMLELQPSFFVHTGDVVYYDKPEPLAKDIAAAREKWNRMYALPLQRNFHMEVPCYFLKDDHDILKDDCWPGQQYGDLTWEDGLALFREQTPAPTSPYRTVRWGKDLQVWLLEGREFRSPNPAPDGPEKTILGQEQLDWLTKTTADSDATFKIVISPTPIVGPDRRNKNDNHANAGFSHEGERLREMLAARDDLYVVCGDRHWQYVSVDPATGLREYSCGPTSDAHAGGWSDDQFDKQMHQFLRVDGGFLAVQVDQETDQPRISFRHHAVDGEIVNEESWRENR